jgi:hypothetical protein
MEGSRQRLATGDVLALEVAVPSGHPHLRAVLELRDGREIELQEATVAALVRAYVSIKTDPLRQQTRLVGCSLGPEEGKPGFATWQLLETD